VANRENPIDQTNNEENPKGVKRHLWVKEISNDG
jgi:hypothetical protein